jgi:hypothetical protein
MRIGVRIILLRISRRSAIQTFAAALLTATLAELAPWNLAFAQQLTVLYSFCSQPNCTDGSTPAAGLTMGNHGALYGTTNVGGNSDKGTAFKLAPPAAAGGPWTETVLYSFCSLPNCADGYNPAFRLLMDKHEALFGTAPYGGRNGAGTAFKLTPPAAAGGPRTETVLYSFCSLPNCADGADPQSDLAMDQHGALYGATQFGPLSSNHGTTFKLTPPAASGGLWTETVLYTFCSLSNCTDGDQPRAGLLLDHQGALYGTAQFGGIHEGGVVFKLIPPSKTGGLWAETVLYSFCSVTNCTDGALPQANLIMDPHGALYGTTLGGGIVFPTTVIGGSPDQGTVFKLTPPTANGNNWTETVLFRFCSQSYCADGSSPLGLIMDQHGVLYGTTQGGGSDGRSGTVFKLTAPAATGGLWTETVLYSFCSLPNCADGFHPNADLIMDNHGALYGTTQNGGSNRGGTAFKLSPGTSSRRSHRVDLWAQRAHARGRGPGEGGASACPLASRTT